VLVYADAGDAGGASANAPAFLIDEHERAPRPRRGAVPALDEHTADARRSRESGDHHERSLLLRRERDDGRGGELEQHRADASAKRKG
jgi:hypothetical protein